MANQGGSHEQHVKAGQQSHKNMDTKQASAPAKDRSSSGARKDSHEQQAKAGQHSQKKN